MLFIVRTGFSHRLLLKETTAAGKEQEARVGVLRIPLEEIIMKVEEAKAILTGVLFRPYGRLVLQVTALVPGTELLEAVGGSDHPGRVQTAAAEAQGESLLVEAAVEAVTYGPLLDRHALGNTPSKWTFHEDRNQTDLEGPM